MIHWYYWGFEVQTSHTHSMVQEDKTPQLQHAPTVLLMQRMGALLPAMKSDEKNYICNLHKVVIKGIKKYKSTINGSKKKNVYYKKFGAL